jgi:hypothetical protein
MTNKKTIVFAGDNRFASALIPYAIHADYKVQVFENMEQIDPTISIDYIIADSLYMDHPHIKTLKQNDTKIILFRTIHDTKQQLKAYKMGIDHFLYNTSSAIELSSNLLELIKI